MYINNARYSSFRGENMETIAIELVKVYCALFLFLAGEIGWKLVLYLAR